MDNLQFNRLLIFDGSHALHRSLSEPHLWEMRNLQGYRTGGIYGVLQTILKESSTYNYFPVVVFDGHLSQRRLNIYPNYKKTLDKQLLLENEEDLTEAQLLDLEHRREYNTQREILKQLLPAFGIPVLHYSDWEGDDIIYLLTKMCKDCIVVSDDKDLLQLVEDNENRRCRVRRGMRDEFIDINYLKENNINQNEFVACKAIIGDSSDNIPSACFQVGEKTALGLVKIYQYLLQEAQTQRNTDTIQFPVDDKQLTEVCNKANVSKRKAYLNFNENQFLTNILLMNLSLVDKDVTPDLLQNIVDNIKAEYGNIDLDTIKEILTQQNIKSFLVNNLLDNINRTKNYVDIQSINNTKNICDIKEKKVGKLF